MTTSIYLQTIDVILVIVAQNAMIHTEFVYFWRTFPNDMQA